MSEWNEEDPSWSDVGKRIEAKNERGEAVTGVLEAEELYSDDDEWPCFSIRLDSDQVISFYDYSHRWREMVTK